MKRIGCALLTGVTLALVGCGGSAGGGGGPEKALVPFSASNYDAVAVDVVNSLGSTAPIFSAVEGAAADSPATLMSSPGANLLSGDMASITAYALEQVGASHQRLEYAAVAQTEQRACFSGTVTVTASDADGSQTVSPGDTVTLAADQCVFEMGQPAVNGVVSMQINSIVLDAYGEVRSADIGMDFKGFSVAESLLNGGATLSVDETQVSLAYRNLNASFNGQTHLYNHTLRVAGETLTVTGPVTLNGSTYELSTPEPITLGVLYPDAGVLKIADGHGAYVLTAFSAAGYQNRLYLPGDDVADASGPLHSWPPT